MTAAKPQQNRRKTAALEACRRAALQSFPFKEKDCSTAAKPANIGLPQNPPHRRSTGKWSAPGVPHRGWVCTVVEDLGEPDAAVCQMCETTKIRSVHTMAHPDYPEALRVGCVCAGHMAGDPTGAREREARVRKRSSRRARWLQRRRWRTSRNGHPFINTKDGLNVAVFKKGQGWGARLVDRRTGYINASNKSYASEAAAKLAAFDAIERYPDRPTPPPTSSPGCGHRSR
jgi:hypothetical protein